MDRPRRLRRAIGAIPDPSACQLGASATVMALTFAVLAACAVMVPAHAFGTSETVTSEDGAVPATTEQLTQDLAAGSVLVTLPWGADDSQVGLRQAKEGLTQGPEALAVSPDGRIAVLDSVNRRLVLLDPSGQSLGKIGLRLAQPRFLAVDDQTICVLDAECDRKLASYTWSGQLVQTVALPAFPDVVTGLFTTAQGPCVEIAHGEVSFLTGGTGAMASVTGLNNSRGSARTLAGRPLDRSIRQVATATYSPKDGVRIRTGAVSSQDLRLADTDELQPLLASGAAIDHLVSVDGDGRGGILVGARLSQPEMRAGRRFELAITRLTAASTDSSGVATKLAQATDDSVLLLAESGFAYVGQPYVVAPDGRIFQPIASKDGYTILVYSLGEVQP